MMRPMMQLCATLAEILVEPNTFRDQLTALTRAASRLGVDPDGLQDLFDPIAQEWLATGSELSVETRPVPPLPELYALAADRSVTAASP